MSTESPAAPRPDGNELLNRRMLPRVLAVSAGIGLHAFNEMAIAPVVPVALGELDAVHMLPWIYSLFFTGVIAGGLTATPLRQQLGARRAMLLAAVFYLVSVSLAATAPMAPLLLLGRAMQGLADGWIVAICYSLIAELFPSRLIARVFAVEAIVWAAAAVLGPVLGGAATEAFGWRAGMAVSLPLVAFLLIVAPRVVPAARGASGAYLGRGDVTVVLTCLGAVLLFSLPSAFPDRPAAALALPAGFLIVMAVLRRDAGRAQPFFPTRIFGLGTTVGRGSWVLLLMTAGQSVSTVFLAFALREVFALPPTWSGLVLVTMALVWSVTAVPAGRVQGGQRQTRMLRIGPGFQIAGTAMIGGGLAAGMLPAVIVGQVAVGIGFGLVWGIASRAIMADADPGEKAKTSALLPSIATSGYIVGAGLAGWIATESRLFQTIDIGTGGIAVLLLWGTAACLAALALAAAQGMRSTE